MTYSIIYTTFEVSVSSVRTGWTEQGFLRNSENMIKNVCGLALEAMIQAAIGEIAGLLPLRIKYHVV